MCVCVWGGGGGGCVRACVHLRVRALSIVSQKKILHFINILINYHF